MFEKGGLSRSLGVQKSLNALKEHLNKQYFLLNSCASGHCCVIVVVDVCVDWCRTVYERVHTDPAMFCAADTDLPVITYINYTPPGGSTGQGAKFDVVESCCCCL